MMLPELRLDNWRPSVPILPSKDMRELHRAKKALMRMVAMMAPACNGCASNYLQAEMADGMAHHIDARCAHQGFQKIAFPALACPWREPGEQSATLAPRDANVPQTRPLDFDGPW